MWKKGLKRKVAGLLVTMLLVSESSQFYATNSISGVDIDNGQTYGTYNIDTYSEEVSQNNEDTGCEHDWVEDKLEWTIKSTGTYGFVQSATNKDLYKSNNYGKSGTTATTKFELVSDRNIEYNLKYFCYTYNDYNDYFRSSFNGEYLYYKMTGWKSGSFTLNIVEGTNTLDLSYYNQYVNSTSSRGYAYVLLPEMKIGGTCSKCGESHEHTPETVYTTVPTCTEGGYAKEICSICGVVLSEGEVGANGHSVNGDSLHESMGSYIKNASKVVDATCTTPAYYTFECDNCDFEVTTECYRHESGGYTNGNPLGHTTENGELIKVVSANDTCGSTYDLYKCGRCGEEFKTNYGDYAGHNYIGEVTKEPSCSETGVTTYTCSKCQDSYTSTISKVPHTYGEQGYIEYCTERGGGYQDCEICGYRNWLTYVSAKGHDYVREIVEEKTVSQNGLARYTCSRCEDTYDEVIPASALCAYPEDLDGNIPYEIFFKAFNSGSAYNDNFAIDKDGNIWGWGYNYYNKFFTDGTDLSSESYIDKPRQLTEGVKFTKVVSNNYNVYALTEDGDIYRWGAKNNYGNFLTNDSTNNDGSYARVPEKYETDIKFKDIHTSYGNSYFIALLSEDGDIYISGQGSGIQAMVTGTTGYTYYYMEKLDAGEVKFDSISTGYDFIVAKTTDGDLWAGGASSPYYPGYTTSGPIFAKREIGIKAKSIGTSEYNTYIIDENGDIYGAGSNNNYMMGTSNSSGYTTDLTLIASGLKAVKIDGEYYVTSVLTEDGNVYCIGYNYYDYFPGLNSSNNYDFRKCDLSKYINTEYKVKDMYVNYNGVYMIDEAGNSHCYGSYQYSFPDQDEFNYSSTDGVKQIGYVVHNFNEISDGKVEPTCYDKGLQYLVCADCGVKVSVIVDKLGHDYIHSRSDADYDNFTYTHNVSCSRCDFELEYTEQDMVVPTNYGGFVVNTCDEKSKAIGYNYSGYNFACNTSEFIDKEADVYDIKELTEIEYDIPMKKILPIGNYSIVGLGYDGNIYTWGKFYEYASDASYALKPIDMTGCVKEDYYLVAYEPRLYDDSRVYTDIFNFGGSGCAFKDENGNIYMSGYFSQKIVYPDSSSSYSNLYKMEKVLDGVEVKQLVYQYGDNSRFLVLDEDGKLGKFENGVYSLFDEVKDITFEKIAFYDSYSSIMLAENGDLYAINKFESEIIGRTTYKSPTIFLDGKEYDDFALFSNESIICKKDDVYIYYNDNYVAGLEIKGHNKIKKFINVDMPGYNTYSNSSAFIADDDFIYSDRGYSSDIFKTEDGTDIGFIKLGSMHNGSEQEITSVTDKTCYTPAVNHFKCTNCNSEYDIPFGDYGHDWVLTETVVSREFGVFGEYIYTCSVCGETKEGDSIEYDTLNISDWQYVVDNERSVVSLVAYIGSNPNVEVHDYYYVAANEKWYYTELNNGNSSTFYNNDFIESVTISGNTLAAGESMEKLFYDCDNLVRVEGMPGNSKNMDYAFNSCDNLVSATGLPQGLTSMSSAFRDCVKLEKMEDLPRTLTGVGLSGTFSRCTALKEMGEIPLDTPVDYMSSTFYGCTSLENCPNIPLSVHTASSTFYECTSLKNMCEIGPNLYNMEMTFYGCTNMEVEDLRLNDGNQLLTATFAHCDKIKKVGRLPRPQEMTSYKYNEETDRWEYTSHDGKIYRTDMWQFYETFLDCDGIEEIDIRAGIEGLSKNYNNTDVYYRGIFADCDNIKDIHVGYIGDRSIFSTRYNAYSSSAGRQNTALKDMLGSFMVLTEEEFREYQKGNYEEKIQEYAQTKVALNREDVTIYYDDTVSELEANYLIGYAGDYERYTPGSSSSYTLPGQFKYQYYSTTGEPIKYRWTILLPLSYDTVRKYNVVCEKEKEYDENGVCNNFYEGYNNNLSEWEYSYSESYKRVYLKRYKGVDDTLNIPATIKFGDEDYEVVPMKNFLQDALVSELYFDPELKYPEVTPSITGYTNTEDDGTNQIRSISKGAKTLQYNSQPYRFYASYDVQAIDVLQEDYIRSGQYLVLGPFIRKVGYIPNGVNVVVNESQYLESDLYLPASCVSFDDRKYTMNREYTSTYGEFMSYISMLEVTNNLDIDVYYSCSAADYESQLIANSKHEGYVPQKSHRDTNSDDLCDDCMCLLTLEDWDNHVNLDDKSITLTRYLGDDTKVTVPSKIDVKGEDFSTIMDASYYTFTDTVVEEVTISDEVEFSGLESGSVVIDSWLDKTYGYPSITYADSSVDYYTNFNTFRRSNIKKLVLGNTNVTNFSRLFFEDTTPIESITLPDNLQIADFMFFTGWQNTMPSTKDSTNDYLKEVIYNGTHVSSLRATFAGCTQLSKITDFADCTDIRNMDDTFYGCLSLKTVSDEFLPETAENLSKLEGTFRLSGLTGFGGRIPYGVKTLISTFHGTKSFGEFTATIPNTVVTMQSTFTNSTIKKAVSVPNSVTNMKLCYHNCDSLTEVDTKEIDMDSVIEMTGTFLDCDSLVTADLSGCTSAENMSAIFGSSMKSTDMYSKEYTGYVYKRYNWYYESDGSKSLKTVVLPTGTTLKRLDCAFAGCTALTSVSDIPDGVYDIDNAFWGCTSLPKVTMSKNNDSLYMMRYAFYNSGVTELEIYTSSTNATNPFAETFTKCNKLKKLTLNIKHLTTLSGLGKSTSVEEIYFYSDDLRNIDYAFEGWTSLRVTSPIPYGITSMVSTFRNCDSLEECPSIPDTVISMQQCFYDCDSLVECPEIGDNVGNMNYAFYHCDKLTTAIVGKNAQYNEFAFGYCANNLEIEPIPGTIKTLRKTFFNTGITELPEMAEGIEVLDGTFDTCEYLEIKEDDKLPDSITTMTSTFSSCCNITRAPKIGSNITDMSGAFEYCENLVEIPWDNEQLSNITNMTRTFSNCSALKEFNFDITDAERVDHAFEDCVSLTNVGSITAKNMQGTFSKCSSLVEVGDIGDTVENLTATFTQCSKLNVDLDLSGAKNLAYVNNAFYKCSSLVNQPILPEDGKIENMGGTFSYCSKLKNAQIPATVTSLGGTYAYCYSLESIDKFPEGLTTIGTSDPSVINYIGELDEDENTFMGKWSQRYETSKGYLGSRYKYYFDEELYSDYDAVATELNKPVDERDIYYFDEYEFIGAFSECTSLKSVPEFPDSLRNITYAFIGCTSLEEVKGDDAKEVDYATCAFMDCGKLKKAKINIKYRADFAFANCKSLEDGPEYIGSINQEFVCFNCEKLNKMPLIDISYSSNVGATDWLGSVARLPYSYYNCKEAKGEIEFKIDTDKKNIEYRPILYKTFTNCESVSGILDLSWDVDCKTVYISYYDFYGTTHKYYENVMPKVDCFKNSGIEKVILGNVSIEEDVDTFANCRNLKAIEITKQFDGTGTGTDMQLFGFTYKNNLREMVWNEDIRGYKPTSIDTEFLGYLNMDSWNNVGRTLGGCDDKAGYDLKFDEGLDAKATFEIVGKNATAVWYKLDELSDISEDVVKSVKTYNYDKSYFDIEISTGGVVPNAEKPCIFLVDVEIKDPENYAVFNDTNRYSLQVGYESQTFGFSYVANNENIAPTQVLHIVKKDGNIPSITTVEDAKDIVEIKKVYYAPIKMTNDKVVLSTNKIIDATTNEVSGDETASISNVANNSLATIGTYSLATAGTGEATSTDYDALETTLEFNNLSLDQDDTYYLCYITTNDGAFQTFANPVKLNVNDVIDHLVAEYKGDPVAYGTDYSKDDVEVKAYYSAETVDAEGNDLGVIVPSSYWEIKDGSAEMVESEADGDSKISDIAVFEGAEATYKVPGYKKVDHMKAIYKGPDIGIGSSYSKDDVEVTIYYDAEETESKILTSSEWEVKDNDLQVKAEDLTENMFIIDIAVYNDTYNKNVEAEYEVPAYLVVDHIKAEYKGPAIPYGSEYEKEKVEVTLYFDANEEESLVIANDKWTVEDGDLTAKSEEADGSGKITDVAVYKDDYQEKKANYTVQGYKKIDHMTAEYGGPSIPIGEQYDKEDVAVTLYFTADETDKKVLSPSEWTESSLDVTQIGDNEYTATYSDAYQEKSANYIVDGYKKVDHMKAEYKGEPIPVGEDYSKDEVEVTLYYDAEETDKKVLGKDEWTESDLKVTQVGDNNYTATYTDSYQTKSADYIVDGYKKIDHMTAEYKGLPIPYGTDYTKDDVEVTLYYDAEETDKKVLTVDEWEVKDGNLKVYESDADGNGKVPDIAVYTDRYQSSEAEYKVQGYKKVDHMTAVYNGPAIPIGQQYDKEDVTVTLFYDAEETESKLLNSSEWTESSLDVTNEGDNNFTATYTDTYQSSSAGYVVKGYKKIDHIRADYTGPFVPIGTNYDKQHVKVVIYYDVDETTSESKELTVDEWTESSLLVEKVGTDNEYTATYTDQYHNLSDTYNVEGYKHIHHIKAEYNGPDIEIGKNYDKEDVKVTLCYNSEETDTEVVSNNDWSIKDGDTGISIVGDNNDIAEYSTKYQNLEGEYSVPGINPIPIIDHITAEYKGPDIQIVGAYLKENVEVKVYYTNYPNVDTLGKDDWTESSLQVTKVGDNEYTATYRGKEATYVVKGKDEFTGIEAEYNGDPIRIGGQYDKDEVTVNEVYASGKRVKIDSSDWTESSLDVLHKGANSYTATYNGNEATYTVDGIDFVIGIKADYIGEDVPVKEEYNKDKVEVYLLFNEDEPYKLSSDQWSESGIVVENIGNNEYTATYVSNTEGTFTDNYTIKGIDHIKAIEAEYTGEDINVGEEYNKDEVEVYMIFYQKEKEKVNTSDWRESSLEVSKVGNNEYTATYDGFSDSYEVTGLDHVKDIDADYKGEPVQIKENYNKDDVEVYLVYYEKESEKISSEQWEESSLSVNSIGENKYTATYGEFTDEYSVTGFDEVDKIEAEYKGEPVRINDNYDKEDVVVVVTYKSGNEETLTEDEWTESGLKIEKVGENEYTATYKEVTDTYTVIGLDRVKRIEADYTGEPVKVNEEYDKEDVEVTAYYYEKKKEVLDKDDWSASSLLVKVKGDNEFTATYEDVTDTYIVPGVDEEVGIEAEYKGEPVLIGEEYDKSEVEVKLVYESGNKEVIDESEWTESSLEVTKEGENDYTATYKEFTDEYKVVGFDDTIVAVSIKGTYPEKVLVGEEFIEDLADIEVTYSDGSKQKLAYKYLDEKPKSKVVTKIGTNKYDIGYDGASGVLKVTGVDIDGITATYTGPDIPVGEDYNKDDVTVIVKFTDGTEYKLDTDEFKTSSLTVTKEGSNMYTATWNEFKCKYEVIGVSSVPKEKIVNDNGPKTGDNSMVMLAIFLMMICVIKLLSIFKRGRAVE